MQAAIEDGIILIAPKPDQSLYTSTALDLTLDSDGWHAHVFVGMSNR